MIASSMPTCQSPAQVLLYVPNLLGYARTGLLAAALRAGTSDPVTCFYFCLANILLDGIDGAVARALNQASCPATGPYCDHLLRSSQHAQYMLQTSSCSQPQYAFRLYPARGT